MSDDSDFTAPCSETKDGVRCIVPAHFADDTLIEHEHNFPTRITSEQLDITDSYGVITARVGVGSGHELLVMRDGSIRFAHTCDRHVRFPNRPVIPIRIAPALQFGPHKILDGTGHVVTIRDRLGFPVIDVDPSILCDDCGTHGFVRNGLWSDA